jgi:hypothetical protein
MIVTGKNRIMIFGPKTDGTHIIEFRTAAGEALAISIPRTEASVVRHFSRTHALRAVCARSSMRNVWRAHCVSLTELSSPHPNPYMRVPENPAPHSDGVLVLAKRGMSSARNT